MAETIKVKARCQACGQVVEAERDAALPGWFEVDCPNCFEPVKAYCSKGNLSERPAMMSPCLCGSRADMCTSRDRPDLYQVFCSDPACGRRGMCAATTFAAVANWNRDQ